MGVSLPEVVGWPSPSGEAKKWLSLYEIGEIESSTGSLLRYRCSKRIKIRSHDTMDVTCRSLSLRWCISSPIVLSFLKGFSKSNVHMEWDKIWAINRKVIDPIAPRYTALQKNERVLVNIAGVSEKCQEALLNPKVLQGSSTSIKAFPFPCKRLVVQTWCN